jgi:two-component system, OmpR family, KDP operon response regulator KdpE
MKILLVDDDAEIVTSVRIGFELGWHGIEVLEADTGQGALELVETQRPDLALLDVGLPDMDGYAVLEQIRRFSDMPVIMLTARDQPLDKVRGLEAGADDYVAKPFDHLELLARVRAVLRRLDMKAPAQRGDAIRSGELEVDTRAGEARLAGERIPLTATEWKVLEVLARHPGWTVPHQRLMTRVWGYDHDASLDDLRVFIRRLRLKLGDDSRRPRHIETVRGMGYRLMVE